VSIWRWATGLPSVALAERELQRPDALARLSLPLQLRGPLALRMALRNVLRRRRRFVLSSLLLGVAGAVFMGGLKLRAAWSQLLEQGAAQRLYAIELRMATPVQRSALAPLLKALPEVRVAEAWNSQRASWVDRQGFAVSRAYPDGGHGQLLLRHAPADGTLQRIRLAEGRWLEGPSELVINQAAAAQLDRPVKLGESISLNVGTQQITGRLVGRIEEPMSASTVYRLASTTDAGTNWRLGLAPGVDVQSLAARLATEAAALGLPSFRAVTERDLRHAAAGHLLVLQRALAWVALGTGLVGLVALASALGSSVAERQRELAVMHALGASNRLVAVTVVAEALLVVLLSLLLAKGLGWLLDPWLAAQLAAITGQPIRAHAAGMSLPLWALVALLGGLLASVGASRAAVRLQLGR
jgi:hypothetical protein